MKTKRGSKDLRVRLPHSLTVFPMRMKTVCVCTHHTQWVCICVTLFLCVCWSGHKESEVWKQDSQWGGWGFWGFVCVTYFNSFLPRLLKPRPLNAHFFLLFVSNNQTLTKSVLLGVLGFCSFGPSWVGTTLTFNNRVTFSWPHQTPLAGGPPGVPRSVWRYDQYT